LAFLSETAVLPPGLEPNPSPEVAAPVEEPPAPTQAIAAPTEASPTADVQATEPTLPPSPTVVGPTITPQIEVVETAPILYYAQAAETLSTVAVRFGVQPEEITSPEPIPEKDFINPNQLLLIPRRLLNTTSSQQLMPDSEVVYSPSAIDFDAEEYAREAGGYLSSFREWHRSTGMKSGAEIIERIAIENSINPRLLLALLEYHSNWVFGSPQTPDAGTYPMSYINPLADGLYDQMMWAVNQISIGYYAYREGRLTTIQFNDGVSARLAPDMNAGTAALQYYFAQMYDSKEWLAALDPESGFPALHASMFGNPWLRAQTVEPLYPAGIKQPPLILPFGRNWTWSYTGGPHGAWERDGAYAALDFAPGTTEPGCNESSQWAVAAADGLVVRTGPGLVVLDLDGDGHEQTGWVLVYLHLSSNGRIRLGEWVAVGDQLGHPSCEGGFATGTHLHIARKFNGEWVPADGPLPFNLGGWIAQAGEEAYKGTLTRDGEILTACTCSNYKTFITRTDEDP
jgi:murein DD-endopeptidase MepM/ murein hydrolase activator NlpD